MSTVIFILSFLILLALISYAVRQRERRPFLPESENQPALGSREAVSLFAPNNQKLAEIEQIRNQQKNARERERLLAWATLVDFSALENRAILTEENFSPENWLDALEILTARIVSEDDVRRLTEFCLDNQFDVNKTLINAFQKIWASSPNLRTTTEMFRLAAQTDSAEIFLDVLIEAEKLIKTGKLREIQIGELSELAESQRWLLSQPTRNSGAGFLIKQKTADLRRETTHQ